MRDRYRPIDLARDAAISSASVRLYEREGFLPPVERSASGHRLYRARHLHALRTSRSLMKGYGWVHARNVMRAIHRGDIPATMALVDAKHAGIDRGRHEVEEAVRALRLLSEGLATLSPLGDSPGKPGCVRVGEARDSPGCARHQCASGSGKDSCIHAAIREVVTACTIGVTSGDCGSSSYFATRDTRSMTSGRCWTSWEVAIPRRRSSRHSGGQTSSSR